MVLNEEGIVKVRKHVEEKLLKVPDGTRIHIDKNMLEKLLFEKVEAVSKEGEIVIFKVPVWSGDFLSKIDLSEISFEDVSWACDCYVRNEFFTSNKAEFEKESSLLYVRSDLMNSYESKLHENKKQWYSILYRNTNAVIDFEKSIEFKKGLGIIIVGADFSYTDLTNFKKQDKIHFEFCNFEGTSLPLRTFIENKENRMTNCNFTDLDLNGCKLDLTDILRVHVHSSVFTRTKIDININISIIAFKNNDCFQFELRELLRKKRIEGCFLNGVKVKSDYEKEQTAKKMLENYNEYKLKIISDLDDGLDKHYIRK